MLIASASSCRSPRPARPGVQTAQITDVSGYIEAVARHRERNIDSKVSTSETQSEETVFEESLKLQLDGYVYHPNFLEFTLAGLFGLLQSDFQRSFDNRDFTSSDDGTVLEFDATGRFLKKKKYPGSISLSRHTNLQPRPFLSSLRVITTNAGVVWQYVSEKAPTSIQFNHTDIRLEPLDRREREGRNKNTTFRFSTGYKFTDANALSLVYDRKSIEEEPFNFRFDTDELTLGHRLNFGEQTRHALESELNYFEQRGTFSIERFRWREILRLAHTESLKSIIQTEVLDRKQGSLAGVQSLDERSFLITGTLEHQLYESLVSQLYGWGQVQDFQGGASVKRYGAQLSFDYRKKTPWGRLLANYRPRIERDDRDGGNQDVNVTEERRTFRDPEPIVIQSMNIRASSIRVTSEDRLTFFRPGSDYRLEIFEDRVELRRIATGRIADGQIVLVSYTFNLGNRFKLDTISQQVGIKHDFDFGLSPYYRFFRQDQTVTPKTAIGAIENDIEDHIVGVEYRWKPLRLVAEYENQESTINTFEAVRLSADVRHRFRNGATASLRARWTDREQTVPTDRDTKFWTLEGRYRHPLTRKLTFEGSILYRNEDDTISGEDEGVDVDLALEWLIRQTEFRITYEFSQFEDNFAKGDSSTLFVQWRRNF